MRGLHFPFGPQTFRALSALGLVLSSYCASGQNIGINVNGAAPNVSALLDIDASALPAAGKRGLLIPRMTTVERVAIATPATGLMAYDQTTNSFWYYNGTVWTPMFTTTTGWSLTGNAGTVLGTDFIGTTDNVAFEVRMNNERAGFVSSGTSTSWGRRALWVNTGTNNTAMGWNALAANTGGFSNTAIGSSAMFTNTTGGRNTAVGNQALNLNLSTSDNTAVGYRALQFTASGDNTAVGSEALLVNGLGTDNTAVGSDAMRTNAIGNQNTAVGSNALYTGTGDGNTAVGYSALRASTTGFQNVAMGSGCMDANTSGTNNTAIGYWAMHDNTNGASNAAVGFQALDNNTTGDFNTALGRAALFGTGTQNYNTAVGYNAGNLGCSTATLIGAEIIQNANNYTNISALGYNTTADGSNRVRLGNTAVTSIGGYAGWTTLPSDARYKNNVREDVGGLDFILRLRPVTYNVDVQKVADHLGEDVTVDSLGNRVPREQASEIIAARKEKALIRYTGFIAQEVDSAAKAVGYDFSGVDKVTDSDRMLGLRYAEFVVPLVKAVQEQQMVIGEQRAMIMELLTRLKRIEDACE